MFMYHLQALRSQHISMHMCLQLLSGTRYLAILMTVVHMQMEQQAMQEPTPTVCGPSVGG